MAAGNCSRSDARRCDYEERIELVLLVLTRDRPVHSLAKVLVCQPCRASGAVKQRPDLVAMVVRPDPEPTAPARAQRVRR
jgi:hypothetical protein